MPATHSDIKLGDSVTDQITGLKGIVTAKLEYIHGCIQFGVSPKSKDDKLPDTLYLDWKRLKITGKRVVLAVEESGGPSSTIRGEHSLR